MELADLIIVNKADGELLPAARPACSDLRKAVHLLRPKRAGWEVELRTCSALTGDSVPELWESIVAFHARLRETGELDLLRARQAQAAMWSEVNDTLIDRLRASPGVRERLGELEAAVAAGDISPTAAAHDVLERFLGPD